MFDNLLLSQPARQLALQAANGHVIANTVLPATTVADARKFELLVDAARRRGHPWEVRKPATGGYNCAGHVFATRRTAIFEGKEGEPFEAHVRLILTWDGYRLTEQPLPGDVVLYWMDRQRTELLHVAVVCEVRRLHGGIGAGAPHVLSKWDGGSGECLHHVRHVPSATFGEDFDVQYWTDRPTATGAGS
jgi:hypothetical protein